MKMMMTISTRNVVWNSRHHKVRQPNSQPASRSQSECQCDYYLFVSSSYSSQSSILLFRVLWQSIKIVSFPTRLSPPDRPLTLWDVRVSQERHEYYCSHFNHLLPITIQCRMIDEEKEFRQSSEYECGLEEVFSTCPVYI